MKKALTLVLALVMVLALTACRSGKTNKVEFYNSTVGESIILNMDKSRVDKIFGEPEISFDYCHYDGYGLNVFYEDGRIAEMYVDFPSDSWHYMGDLSGEAEYDDLVAIVGEPAVEQDELKWFYLDNIGKPRTSDPQKVFAVSVDGSDKINCIFMMTRARLDEITAE